MTHDEWLAQVPEQIKQDAVWRIEAYRLSLFIADLTWRDLAKIAADARTRGLVDQLYRAVGSISANVAEGFSRVSHKEKARFYEYALGSARESRDWYYKVRHVLAAGVFDHRLDILTQIIRLLITMVPDQRQQTVREDFVDYNIDHASPDQPSTSSRDNFEPA